MSTIAADRGVKACCATFYQSDIARALLGNVFHPGGLALTHHLGEWLALGPGDRVLDVACGRGASAVHLAYHFGCSVTGIDFGTANVATAHALAAERGVGHLATFQQGDAEDLPFDAGAFDAVISECSFCTFLEKATAAAEMARVLRPGGRLGLTDMVVTGLLPDDVQTMLAWVACVTGAGTTAEHVATLRAAGFTAFNVEDQRASLLDLVTDVRRRLLGIELAAGLGAPNLSELDVGEAKRLARRAVELIEDGTVGYTLIFAKKDVPAPA